MDLFCVRLNCIDHYQATPSVFDPQLRCDLKPSELQNEPKIPVIRVFGSTETGQKVCAHIHGAFPYLYIEYCGSLMHEEVSKYIQKLHLSIDKTLATIYRRNSHDRDSKYVASITLVKGIPFYGFHVGYSNFLKIYMLNPMAITRLSDALRQGTVMNKVFQPYEAHLQYQLQWMTDYNIFGSNYIKARRVAFRAPIPKFIELEQKSHIWHDRSIPKDWVIDEQILQRSSYCSLEVDICVQDILNRQEIEPRYLHHELVVHLNPQTTQERLVHSMAELWKDETKRRRAKMSNSESGSSPFPLEVLLSMSADPRHPQAGGWIHEEDYNQKLRCLIDEEKDSSDGAKLTFESFLNPVPEQASIKTALKSVEDLFPANPHPILGLNTLETENHNLKQIENIKHCDEKSLIQTQDHHHHQDFTKKSAKNYFKYDYSVNNTPSPKVENCNSLLKISHTSNIKNIIKLSQDTQEKLFRMDETKTDVSNGEYVHILMKNRMDAHPWFEVKSCQKLKRKSSSSPSETSNKRSSFPCNHWLNDNYKEICEDNAWIYKHSARGKRKSFTSKKQTSQNSILQRLTSKNCKPNLNDKVSFSKEKSQDQTLNFPIVKSSNQMVIVDKIPNQKKFHPFQSEKEEKMVSYMTKQSPSPNLPTKNTSFCSISSDLNTLPNTLFHLMWKMKKSFYRDSSPKLFVFHQLPPSRSNVILTMQKYNISSFAYQDAFYSNELDVPEHNREWAGREFKLGSLSVIFLPEFRSSGIFDDKLKGRQISFSHRQKSSSLYSEYYQPCSLRSWSIAEPPPTRKDVCEWLRRKTMSTSNKEKFNYSLKNTTTSPQNRILSQIEGPTQKNQYGFKYSQDCKSINVSHESLFMSIMGLEIHINTRGKLFPNPEQDEVKCLFWCFKFGEEFLEHKNTSTNLYIGIVLLSEDDEIVQRVRKQFSIEVYAEVSELDLIIRIVNIVRSYDPDILIGYEVNNNSWGYLIKRARMKYDYDLSDELSRIKTQPSSKLRSNSDKWGLTKTSAIYVTGRHIINIWRAMQSELNLLQYTMENVVFHLLHRRIPHFSWADLTQWFTDGKARSLAIVIDYYLSRVRLNFEILERNEFIERTSEQARLLGVDFFSVISRGSQYKVESLMFRIAKPENFLLITPSRKQVGSQNALECLPLVMEPQSAFYTSPLLVLDFQSLYPSLIIAYNYCYSTFLGRIINWCGKNKMGFTEYKRQKRLLELLQNHINISPNGMMYVKSTIRKSLLAKMLGEILETRLMVKSGMRRDKNDKALQRLLNNRQLALKLISNVTYGYTSASFSGRMPCSEIADSIVQTGRETLEKAIALIHSMKKWNAEVVYSDTDSLFVYLKGRTKDQAFDIGTEIAKTITDINPRPVKLKFEKIYLPCILIAKKRYVGFKYETRNQVEPEFDAKGIETVRRDGTPAEQKIEEKALKILFRTSDLSQVKNYFQKQCEKIMKGSVSIQDFCFAKEVKLGTYSEKRQLQPGALISTKRMKEDIGAEPQYAERVPYVVISGAPGARLIDRCVAPEILLENSYHQLDSDYYISKNLIPPLERIFNLVGANIRSWYEEMRKFQRIRRVDPNGDQSREATTTKIMESYMKSMSCLVCKERLEIEGTICGQCVTDLPNSIFLLKQRFNKAETKFLDIQKVCQSCSRISPIEEVRCDSKDCPVYYTRRRQWAYLKSEKCSIDPLIRDLTEQFSDVKVFDW